MSSPMMNDPHAVGRSGQGACELGARGYLSPYRVLDLTDERGLLAGRMLAQLGADVIQIEPPGGSPGRRTGPFDADGQSLYWSAYAAGKRSFVCDIYSSEGRAIFEEMLHSADFLIETPAVDAPENQKLTYAYTSGLNPRLIHVSITPFGSDGPKACYADSDLVLWAAGGALWPSRDADDRGPIRISVPQAYLHSSADAAGGALVALFARHHSGVGQHVEISTQKSVMQATLSSIVAAAVGHEKFALVPQSPTSKGKKVLDLSGSGSRTRRSKWQVLDGLAEMHLAMGPSSGRSSNNLFAWMREEGALPERFHGWDWITLPARYERGEIDDSDIETARGHVAAFLGNRTKKELLEQAIQRRILLAPVCSMADLLDSPHHAARDFFRHVDEGDRKRVLPGPFAMGMSHGFAKPVGAPALGAHNREILAELNARRAETSARLAEADDATIC